MDYYPRFKPRVRHASKKHNTPKLHHREIPNSGFSTRESSRSSTLDILPAPDSPAGLLSPPSWDEQLVFEGSIVTLRRLYPRLENILNFKKKEQKQKRKKEKGDDLYSNDDITSELESTSSSLQKWTLPKELDDALRVYVFNQMPIRLLQLPEKRLLERNDVVQHITSKMALEGVDNVLFQKMVDEVRVLAKDDYHQNRRFTKDDSEDEEDAEDARENPVEAVCRFLFLKYARYAILSHTWASASEVTYKDANDPDWPTQFLPATAGFAKLDGFCKVAEARHGVSLAWIDTVCINKDSSSELDESIQSMFQWYQRSWVCITYLRDTTCLADMKYDRWFTRGWTLQELLAPKTMKFYQRDWSPLVRGGINDKTKTVVQKAIYDATRIKREELLVFDPITGSDVPTRMSWAASRVTTRGEDRAYSLMGIFGVNFSTSYGEGADRAFFRLIEAIISSRPAEQVFPVLAWRGTPISDKIHTSHLIPSGPECYVEDNLPADSPDDRPLKHTFVPSIVKPMMLTHLGLRVELLFARTISEKAELLRMENQKYGPFDVKLRVVPSSTSQIRVPSEIELQKRFPSFPPGVGYIYDNPHRASTGGHHFFLGIYTFREDEEENCIYLPSSCQAFLFGLFSDSTDVSMSTLSQRSFRPSSKVDTRTLLRVFCDSESKVMNSELKKRDMKLLNLYL